METNNNTKRKAIILARVSTDEQREAGNSLPAQIKRLETYCDRKGFEVFKKYSFDESAYKSQRDEFDRILEDIGKETEKIVVCFDKVDRLSRNVFDKRVSALYEKAISDEIELHFVSDGQIIDSKMSAVEKFQFGMSLGLAKYYSDAISDNVKRAYEQKLRTGNWIGKAPIGYLNVGEEKNHRDIIVDPVRRPYIERIYDLYLQGNSMLSIQRLMQKEGLRSWKGTPLSKSSIERILNNKFYCGIMTSKGREYPHRYPKIIPDYKYNKVNALRKTKRKSPNKTISKPFIFKGLVSCANCNCSITAELKKGKYVYYSCTNSKKICERIYIPENKLLKPVYDALKSIQLDNGQVELITAEIRKMNQSKTHYHTTAIQSLRNEYDKYQRRLDALLDLLLDESITKTLYDEKFKKLKEEQRDIEIQLEDHTTADEDYSISAAQLISLAQRAADIFASSEIDEKRQLLNWAFQNFELKQKKLLFELNLPLQALTEYKERPLLLRGRGSNPRPRD